LDYADKGQLTLAIPTRVHEQPTFQKPAKFDRRETEVFRKLTNLRYRAVIVARQEHDSLATMCGWILVRMIEPPSPISGSTLGHFNSVF
jgi:hypothetical protein